MASAWNYIMTQITDFEQFTRWRGSGEKKNKWQKRFQRNCHNARPLKQEVDIFCACHEHLGVKYENKSSLERKRKSTGDVTFDL